MIGRLPEQQIAGAVHRLPYSACRRHSLLYVQLLDPARVGCQRVAVAARFCTGRSTVERHSCSPYTGKRFVSLLFVYAICITAANGWCCTSPSLLYVGWLLTAFAEAKPFSAEYARGCSEEWITPAMPTVWVKTQRQTWKQNVNIMHI